MAQPACWRRRRDSTCVACWTRSARRASSRAFAVAARMIDFDDKRWEGLKGGYKIAYDPRPALRELESGNPVDPIWDELWEDLHHQDTIGEASYAAVPHLIRHISRS